MTDLLIAFAAACPFIAVAALLYSDTLSWLDGHDTIGAGESTYEGVLPVGLSATLTTSRSAAGADTPFDWDAA